MTVKEYNNSDIIVNQEKLYKERLERVLQRKGYTEREIRMMSNDPKVIKEIIQILRNKAIH